MKQARFWNFPVQRWLQALIWTAALTAVACSGDVSVGPVAPDWPDWPDGWTGVRPLQISGTLEAEDGRCFEATVLYDGRELAQARSLCPQARGCARLEVEAGVSSIAGHHTISFKILRQSQEVVKYRIRGMARLSGEGLSLPGVEIPLGPESAALKAGESVSFGIDFID